jgi:hypothetical protein
MWTRVWYANTGCLVCKLNCHLEIGKVYSRNMATLITRGFTIIRINVIKERLCGLVVRVLGYRSGGPGFDSRHYKKYWVWNGVDSAS